MQDVGRVANTKAFSTMVERSPAIVEDLAHRLKQRNATYFEVNSPSLPSMPPVPFAQLLLFLLSFVRC